MQIPPLAVELLLAGLAILSIHAVVVRGRVDHVVAFAFGVAFYVYLPIILFFSLDANPELPELEAWIRVGSDASNAKLVQTLLVATAFIGLFVVVELVFRLRRIDRPVESVCSGRFPRWMLFGWLLLVIIEGFAARGFLFRGYSQQTFDTYVEGRSEGTAILGPFISACLTVYFFIFYESLRANGRRLGSLRLGICILLAALLLSAGSRLYVVTILATFFINDEVYNRRKRNWPKRAVLLTFALCVAAAIAVWRQSGSDWALGGALSLLLEPIFSSWALFSYLGANDPPMLGDISVVFSQLLNVVPTFLMPNKVQLIDQFKVANGIETPLGGFNVLSFLYVAFGSCGALLFIFSVAILLSLLKREGMHDIKARYLYGVIAGTLPFVFFRELPATSIAKFWIQFGIAFPLLIEGFVFFVANTNKRIVAQL